jgi:predicted O-methyltransferase YrrM
LLDNGVQPSNLDERFHASYEAVMGAYRDLGYPNELLGQWALPERDALTLLAEVEELQPRNILEVGTYVGVTSLLLALHTSADTRIHTVDPNFPLQIEMSAMQSNLYGSNVAVKTQQLGQQAAHSLGLDGRIVFHEGGFSVGSTFSSNNADPLARVEVVGAELCAQYGPFDCIFVDGLHYEDAVLSDLNLAARHITPEGVIGIHDAKGRWASNVRRAVFRFLEEHDDFFFFHRPFTEIDRAIGFLGRRGSARVRLRGEEYRDLTTHGLLQDAIFSNLASTLVEIFSPKRVVQFHSDGLDLGNALLARGVTEVLTVCPDVLGAEPNADDEQIRNLRGLLARDGKYDLCLCLGVAERLTPGAADELVRICSDLTDRVIFAATPPGELGEAIPNLYPISHWAKMFLRNGFVLRDAIRPRLEPLTYVDQVFADYRVTSSYLHNLYLAERVNSIAEGENCNAVESLLLSKEARIEDLTLQSFYQTLIIHDARERLANAESRARKLDSTRQELEKARQELGSAAQEAKATRKWLEESRGELETTRHALEVAQQAIRRGSWPRRFSRRVLRSLASRAHLRR